MNLEICKKCLDADIIELDIRTLYHKDGKPCYVFSILGKGKELNLCPLMDYTFSHLKCFESREKVDKIVKSGKTNGIIKFNKNCKYFVEQKISEWNEK